MTATTSRSASVNRTYIGPSDRGRARIGVQSASSGRSVQQSVNVPSTLIHTVSRGPHFGTARCRCGPQTWTNASTNGPKRHFQAAFHEKQGPGQCRSVGPLVEMTKWRCDFTFGRTKVEPISGHTRCATSRALSRTKAEKVSWPTLDTGCWKQEYTESTDLGGQETGPVHPFQLPL